MNDEPIVYVVDDDPGVLKALSRLLRSEGYAVCAFHSSEEFLREHDANVPGCVVLDICMPDMDGLVLQQALLTSESERPIIFLTGHADVATSVTAMKAGAIDFIMKPFHDEDFLAAVRNAIARDEHARKIRNELRSIQWRIDTLTPREHQVLQQVVAGRLNKQIAADLGIAEKTIKVHRARAMEKMGVDSLAELVRLSVEADAGIISDASLQRKPWRRDIASLSQLGEGRRAQERH